jgi:hypothetical protein
MVSFSAYPNNTTNNNNGRPGTPDSDTSYNTALSSHDAASSAHEDEDDFSEYTTNGAYTDGGDGFGTINGGVASYDLCADAYIFRMAPIWLIWCRSC